MTDFSDFRISLAFLFVLVAFPPANAQHVDTKDILIIDTHIDTPYSVRRTPRDVLVENDLGEFDLPRAKAGGLDVIFMSIYTPATAHQEGTSRSVAIELIQSVETMALRAPEDIAIATCTEDIDRLYDQQKLIFAYGLENASPLEGKVDGLWDWYNRGIRYITLAHSKWNEFSDSSYDEDEHWQGLSPNGERLVAAMNRFGIMIDISHLSDLAAMQVLELSTSPVLATHSSLRHFIPGFHRNISDEMVMAVKENQGVIHINFGSSFVSEKARTYQYDMSEAFENFAAEKQLSPDEARQWRIDWSEKHPFPFASIDTVIDHIDRVVELVGIDYVGFGSDFDGVGDTLPIGLKDVSDYPKLITRLYERGYSDEEVRKIAGGNLMRVWRENEKRAALTPQCRQGSI